MSTITPEIEKQAMELALETVFMMNGEKSLFIAQKLSKQLNLPQLLADSARVKELEKLEKGIIANAPKCGACAGILFTGGRMEEHCPDCVYTERDSLRERVKELEKLEGDLIELNREATSQCAQLRAELELARKCVEDLAVDLKHARNAYRLRHGVTTDDFNSLPTPYDTTLAAYDAFKKGQQ